MVCLPQQPEPEIETIRREKKGKPNKGIFKMTQRMYLISVIKIIVLFALLKKRNTLFSCICFPRLDFSKILSHFNTSPMWRNFSWSKCLVLPDQELVNKLLAMSMQEDELSQSMQNLGTSFIKARSVLQAAYTEVQRLLLLRQQVPLTEI